MEKPEAVFRTRAVFEVVGAATTGGLLGRQLPGEYDRLLAAGSTDRMPR